MTVFVHVEGPLMLLTVTNLRIKHSGKLTLLDFLDLSFLHLLYKKNATKHMTSDHTYTRNRGWSLSNPFLKSFFYTYNS